MCTGQARALDQRRLGWGRVSDLSKSRLPLWWPRRRGAGDAPRVPGDRRHRLLGWPHLPASVGYAVLTAAVLWPAVAHFRTRQLADDIDGTMFAWVWWAMPRALAEGRNPYRTDLVFHPVGSGLELTTTSPLVNLLTWPVQAAFGSAAQVNTIQLASMFLAGLATYFLAHRVCGHRGASFVAGAAYALLPRRFVHVEGQLNLIETAIIPFGLLVFLRFAEAPTRRRAISLGITCGAAFLIDPQLTVLLGMGLLALLWTHRRVVTSAAHHLLLALATALVVAAPLLVPMALALSSGQDGSPDPTRSVLQYSASPLSWVVPPLDRLWVGNAASIAPLTPNHEGVAYPGLIMLGLALWGVELSLRARRRGWVAMSLVAFVLSLGPYPFVRDASLDIPLPFFILAEIPGLQIMRVPGRYALLGAAGIYMLAALALADLVRRIPQRATLIVGLVGTLTIVELLPRSLPSTPATVPSAYEVLADDTDEGAVLELPLKWSTTQQYFGFDGHRRDFRFLAAQIVHERPIVSGAVARYPDDDLRWLTQQPVYRQLLAMGGEPKFDDPPRFSAADLEELGIRYVVYHRDDPVPEALAYMRTLRLPVLADDGTVIIWKVAG